MPRRHLKRRRYLTDKNLIRLLYFQRNFYYFQPIIDQIQTSSVQTISIRAKLRVFSETWLENLNVSDKCKCDNEPPTPLELVFLLDGSDSFNIKAQGIDGKLVDEASFEFSAAWIADFLTSGNFGRFKLLTFKGRGDANQLQNMEVDENNLELKV